MNNKIETCLSFSFRTLFVLFGVVSCLVFAGDSWGQDEPRVVLVVGTHHYSPHRTLPVFAKELQRHGFRTTVVNGEGDPEKKTENVLPGIESLAKADVAIFYMRFLNLPQSEWKHVEDYIKSGKPVIGLRTTNHAVKFAQDDPRVEWNESFGRRVVGTPYIAHQDTKTNIGLVEKHQSHPILSGVAKTKWESSAKLYLTRLEPGCVPLMVGEGEGKGRLLEKPFGTIQLNVSETDVVAWTWQNQWGAKVFATSLGHTEDFAQPAFTRMLVNGVCWATDREPVKPDVDVSTWDIKMDVPSKYQPRRK